MAGDAEIIGHNEKEMNLVGHLTELRNRLIATIICFAVLFGAGFYFVKDIFQFILMDFDFTLNFLSPIDIISVYFTIAGTIAIVGTIPILSFQAWAFVKPGLTKRERRASLSYIPATFFLFIVGLLFGYFAFNDLIMPFLLKLNDGFANELFTFEKYFKFMVHVIIPFALLFEIPVVTMFLTSLGIVTPKFLRQIRKYAYLVLVIVGTIITPPDFVLEILVAIPLIALYEISIYLSRIVYRKKQKRHQTFMN